MNFKKYHVSKNLAPPLSEWVDGYINSSGTISTAGSDTREKSSDYIELLDEQVITFSYPDGFPHTTATNAWRVIAFYKSDKTFLTRIGGAGDITALTASVPENAKYARLSMRNYGRTGNTMLNSGSEALPYEPYSSEVWHDIPHYIHKTATDTLTLPAVIYPNDTSITVGLKGNEEHTGTPTPDSPIMPQGTGERTGNLLDYTTVENTSYATAIPISGGINISGKYFVRFRTVKFTVGTSYTMSWTTKTISGTVSTMWRFHYSDNTYSSMPSSGWTLIAEKEVSELLLYVNGSSTESGVAEITNIMLNLGSTALPYEPYGIKIPISSANTTTPVYLGEVQTTRKVKKLVLDGTESWESASSSAFRITITNAHGFNQNIIAPVYCSHYVAKTYTDIYNGNEYGIGVRGGSTESTRGFAISKGEITTVSDFKSYLQQQYAAGTPVTVWYVLATEETAVVNEPLRKIGDYADAVSGISIPTTAGANTISVDTTLQPSEITVGYKGWHSVQNVHEHENGAWD